MFKKDNNKFQFHAEAIANLSGSIKEIVQQSHDRFKQITKKILWLNLTLHGMSDMYVAIRQLEFAILHVSQRVDALTMTSSV